jgi:hypothetical protein
MPIIDTHKRAPGVAGPTVRPSNICSGRQLRAARVLAGLTQAELARTAGYHTRAVRYWEAKGDDLPTCVPDSTIRPPPRAPLKVRPQSSTQWGW